MAEKRIGLRDVRTLGVGEVLWDSAVAGFGARRQKGDAISYILKYRTTEGRQRWHTIGRHGAPWTPETARDEAKRLLGQVAAGGDPAEVKAGRRAAPSVVELCDAYVADARAGRLLTRRKSPKKASTLATDVGRIERHIKPLLGALKVSAVTRDDVERFMHDVAEGRTAAKLKTGKPRGLARVAGGRGTASRTIGLLGAIFSYAVRHRMRLDNPVHGVIRFADGQRERRLTEEEYRALGEAFELAAARELWPPAIAAAKFLALTGWRSGEVLGLKWEEVDLGRRTALLGDTKTGRSVRPLSKEACEVLRSMTRIGPLVFPASRGEGRMSGFPKVWRRLTSLGGLGSGITPHTLRHSFASLASDLGYSEATIASLVGHKGRSITSRYIHSADSVLLSASDAVARSISGLIGLSRVASVIDLPRASSG